MQNIKEKKVAKRLVIVLDDEMHQELKVSAAQRSVSMKEILVQLLKKWLEKNGSN